MADPAKPATQPADFSTKVGAAQGSVPGVPAATPNPAVTPVNVIAPTGIASGTVPTSPVVVPAPTPAPATVTVQVDMYAGLWAALAKILDPTGAASLNSPSLVLSGVTKLVSDYEKLLAANTTTTLDLTSAKNQIAADIAQVAAEKPGLQVHAQVLADVMAKVKARPSFNTLKGQYFEGEMSPTEREHLLVLLKNLQARCK